eukprot:7281663-Prymnesium_polylepis.1
MGCAASSTRSSAHDGVDEQPSPKSRGSHRSSLGTRSSTSSLSSDTSPRSPIRRSATTRLMSHTQASFGCLWSTQSDHFSRT